MFFNGDIVLDRESEEQIYGPYSQRIRWKRAATRGSKRLWKDGIVPFTFSDVCEYCSFAIFRYRHYRGLLLTLIERRIVADD